MWQKHPQAMLRLTRVKNKKSSWEEFEEIVRYLWWIRSTDPAPHFTLPPVCHPRRVCDTDAEQIQETDTQTVTEIQSQIERIGKKTDEGREIIIHIEEERYTDCYRRKDT